MMIKYFAYGSNMCTGRLRMRVPSAEPFCVARLNGHDLRFQKRSKDGSAKADACDTKDSADCIYGVVFVLSEAEKRKLDEAEGLGHGYAEKQVIVEDCAGSELSACMYYADDAYTNENLRPYCWYLRFVVDGAKQHNLPEEYIERIEAVNCDDDPCSPRDELERGIQC